ncbi:MAG: LCP family protein [Patescibacteria group bacterium]
MVKKKINITAEKTAVKNDPPAPIVKKPWWRRFWLTGILLAVSLFVFAYSVIGRIDLINKGVTGSSLFSQLGHIITRSADPIDGEAQDRINFLLLGIGGAGHDGALLTDTIIVASLKPSTGQVAMISIPRDLIVEFPTYYNRKINNAIVFGQQLDYPGGGDQLSVAMVEQVTGLDINYYGRIDFSGFEQIVDQLAGVAVTVDNSFIDYQYPTNNYGYQTVSFTAGEQTLSGDRALKFVRSRHGNNGEGSDFARSRRQQKVLAAIQDKAFSLGTLTNPVKMQNILNTVSSNVKTNMEFHEMLRFSSLLKEADTNNIITVVLENGQDGLLTTTSGIDGAYILEPKAGDFSEIQKLSQNVFQAEQSDTTIPEKATIAIHNGTLYGGLARTTAEKIGSNNIKVVEVANALTRDNSDTVIYDLTGGEKPQTLSRLKSLVSYAHVSSNLPFFLDSQYDLTYENINASVYPVLGISTSEVVDFLIILGTDAIANTNTNNPSSV